jgi:hypothetical protein
VHRFFAEQLVLPMPDSYARFVLLFPSSSVEADCSGGSGDQDKCLYLFCFDSTLIGKVPKN